MLVGIGGSGPGFAGRFVNRSWVAAAGVEDGIEPETGCVVVTTGFTGSTGRGAVSIVDGREKGSASGCGSGK